MHQSLVDLWYGFGVALEPHNLILPFVNQSNECFRGDDMPRRLHDDSIIIDGLIIAKWGPDVFRAMRAGGVTAANCTCSV